MKGFVIILIILILLGATVFYFGWIQIQVDDSEYSVIFTKLNGWEENVIYPGEFVWRWQGAVPTMLKRYDFSSLPRSVRINVSESLPAGSLYSDLLPSKPDFAYSVDISVNFGINPDALPRLAEDEGLRPDGLEAFLDARENSLKEAVQDTVAVTLPAIAMDAADAVGENIVILQSADLQEKLAAYLIENFPELNITSVAVEKMNLPDLELYALARQRYLSIMDSESEARRIAQSEIARIQLVNNAQRESLQTLGELLDSHPSLLQYLSIVGQTGSDPLGLSPLFGDVLTLSKTLGSNPALLQAVDQGN